MELYSRSLIRFNLGFSLLGHYAVSLVFRHFEGRGVFIFKRQGVPRRRPLDVWGRRHYGPPDCREPLSQQPRRHIPEDMSPPRNVAMRSSGLGNLFHFTLLYCVYGHRFTPDVLQCPGSHCFAANHEQTDLTGSRCGRPVTIYTCIRFLVRTSAKKTAVLTDMFVVFVSTNKQKPGVTP
jgi:hypothetical protein